MAVLTKIRERAVNGLMKAGDKGADLVAKASGLSSAQLKDVEAKREKFLSERPDTDPEGIRRLLGAYAIEAYEAYLPQIAELYDPMNIDDSDEASYSLNRIRYFEITKWVTDPNEDNIDKLVSLYQVVSEEECNIALIYVRKVTGCKVYLAVVNERVQNQPTIVNALEDRLVASLKGNFPGAEIRTRSMPDAKKYAHFGVGVIPELENLRNVSVAAVSNIASEKSDDFVSQCMEKLLDGINPEQEGDEYIIVLLATPVREQLERRNELSELYSKLAPYSSWQTNFTFSETHSQGSSATFGASLGASAGAQFGRQQSEGNSSSTSAGESHGSTHSDSQSKTTTDTSSSSVTGGASVGIPGGPGAHVDATAGTSHAEGTTKGTTETKSTGKTLTNTVTKMAQTGQSAGASCGVNFGVQFSRASNVSVTLGKNEGITQSYVNHGIKYTLDLIEKQIKRLEESSALGMWDFSAYFLSENAVIANNAAHMYLALTQGEESYISQAAVNLWTPEGHDPSGNDAAGRILKFIRRLQHPEFEMKDLPDEEWLMYPAHVNTTVSLTGRELAHSLNFPKKSVSGLPVLESVSFGREVQRFAEMSEEDRQRRIEIGKIYHMRREERTPVELDIDSLASHVFVTGSTGAGKSNAIYQMLDHLNKCGVKFLVVEPAKGEYKKVFGKRCRVYGTNREKAELLRMNPFSFPEDIHVLEHIDRLVEILNACWPMYAAMPAILKDAIEKCYEKVGWNLTYSICEPLVFPTFYDLQEILPEVLETSYYSGDTKSDYSGALVTRVHSLTNGINGQILCCGKELSAGQLFEDNVIVDLSRIGSNETRSLLMGIVVMKLQEYRLHLDSMNEKLLHVTVLEEAHNLLRKTSTGQAQESANLQGKSVEMITNSIAEMRTYGEGFIIADQAPELLDDAVIRNTNTKVVLRLPGEADRKTVGLSMALNEDQIQELARLPRGVAAIYQNDWVESTLCHFEKYDQCEPYTYVPLKEPNLIGHFLKKVFGVSDDYEISTEDADAIREWIDHLRDMPATMRYLLAVLDGSSLTQEARNQIAYNVFDGKRIAKILEDEAESGEGVKKMERMIAACVGSCDADLLVVIRTTLLHVILSQNHVEALRQRYLPFEKGERPVR